MEKEVKQELTNEETNESNNGAALTLTQEELNALLQKEGDKRVTAAQERWERREKKRLSEAEKLAKMDEDARRVYEIEQRELQLEEKERLLIIESNKAQCNAILSSKGLDTSLVELVVDEDAEVMDQRIKLIEKAIKSEVSKQVLDRIGSDTPAAGSTSSGAITKESFRKMSLAEQMEIFRSDKELYDKLAK